MEDEYVSVMDPILLSIIQHPARCIFCTHSTCFDANVFFKFQVTSMNWQCPICCVKIRGIQVRQERKKKIVKMGGLIFLKGPLY